MNWILPIDTFPAGSGQLIGGKGVALRRLSDRGLPIPRTLCVTTRAYNDFIDGAGLREKINLELHRKIFILGAVEAQLISAAQEGRRRMAAGSTGLAELMAELGLDREGEPNLAVQASPPPIVSDRQITGQPAGPGLARGRARVIQRHTDIARFKRGEIIVCDGVDPNMTFVMPLAAGIVERRGGMLIHGAIIAREYGLPCVTGVADATRRIRTGQQITVDGYLGIVTLAGKFGKEASESAQNKASVR
jgi:phosphoenolpyruvate synthase/pyruvate phosphate dikinase